MSNTNNLVVQDIPDQLDPLSSPSVRFSDPSLCSTCNRVLEIGDYPFCPHESIYARNAQAFDPIVLFQNPETGAYSFPGSSGAALPAGHRRVEITNLRQADRVTSEINRSENQEIREQWHKEQASRGEKQKARREELKELMRKMTPEGRRAAEQAMEYADRKRERRSMNGPKDANFHMDVIAYDSSNRDVHTDRRTDWRGRKG